MSVDPEGTPDAGNSPDPTAAQENWEQRFKDTQAAFTKSQQELAAAQKLMNGEDPEALRSVLDRYGYELADDEDDADDYEDPADDGDDPYDARLAAIEQREQARAAAEEQQVRQDEWHGWQNFVKDKAKAEGIELTDREVKSFQLDSVGDNGLPVPPAKAEQILKTYLEERAALLDGYVAQQRKRPRAPHVPAGGQPASDVKDTSDMSISELNRFAMDRLNAESA